MISVSRDVVGGVIVSSDERLLLGRKKPGTAGVYHDMWIFPGGVVDPETDDPLNTFYEELSAETTLDRTLLNPQLIEFDPPLQDQGEITLLTGERIILDMTFIIYQCLLEGSYRGYKIQPGDELEQLRWISKRNLGYLTMPKPSYIVLDRVGLLKL